MPAIQAGQKAIFAAGITRWAAVYILAVSDSSLRREVKANVAKEDHQSTAYSGFCGADGGPVDHNSMLAARWPPDG